MGPMAGLDGCEKSRSADRPDRSESLCRPRCPGPQGSLCGVKMNCCTVERLLIEAIKETLCLSICNVAVTVKYDKMFFIVHSDTELACQAKFISCLSSIELIHILTL